jgi:hypothetical protein
MPLPWLYGVVNGASLLASNIPLHLAAKSPRRDCQGSVLFRPMPRWCLSWSCRRPEREELSQHRQWSSKIRIQLQQESVFTRNVTEHDTAFALIIIYNRTARNQVWYCVCFVLRQTVPTWKSIWGINPLSGTEEHFKYRPSYPILFHFIPLLG